MGHHGLVPTNWKGDGFNGLRLCVTPLCKRRFKISTVRTTIPKKSKHFDFPLCLYAPFIGHKNNIHWHLPFRCVLSIILCLGVRQYRHRLRIGMCHLHATQTHQADKNRADKRRDTELDFKTIYGLHNILFRLKLTQFPQLTMNG